MSGRVARVLAPAVLLGLGLGLVLLGVASWPLLAAAALPWLLLATRRWGLALGACATLLVSLLLFLLSLMATGALHLPMVATVSAAALVLGAVGIAVAARATTPGARPSRIAALTVLPALAGGVVWLATAALAFVVPGASRLSWVMLGDSANNVLFAREVVYRGGLATGPGENPVPLPTALLGYVIAAGRDGVDATQLLPHDIRGFVVTWSLLIALSCLVIGAAAATIARHAGARAGVVGAVAAGASLLPLSWFFTGYPLEYGFFNTHLAFVVIFAAVMVYFAASSHPAVAVGLLAVAATLLLAIWSPLVLLPLALAAALLLRSARALLRSRGLSLIVMLAGAAQLAIYGLAIVLPGLLRQAGFLSAGGGVFGFRKWMIVALAVVALGLAVLAARGIRNAVVIGTLAVTAASALGLALLLAVSRAWSYYPTKFAWLVAAVLLVFAVALAAAVASRAAERPALRMALLAGVAIATVGFLLWTPRSGPPYAAMNPVQRVLSGSFLGPGDAIAEQIFALDNPGRPTVLWNSGDSNESVINFWLLQMRSDSMSQNLELKAAAYGLYDHDKVADLCDIVGWMGGSALVLTADSGLEAAATDACPTQAMTFEMTTP